MTIGDAIEKAVKERCWETAGGVADCLRFRHGRNYEETFRLVLDVCERRGIAPPDKADWDQLLYEADRH